MNVTLIVSFHLVLGKCVISAKDSAGKAED